jgi:hypothetical protein
MAVHTGRAGFHYSLQFSKELMLVMTKITVTVDAI